MTPTESARSNGFPTSPPKKGSVNSTQREDVLEAIYYAIDGLLYHLETIPVDQKIKAAKNFLELCVAIGEAIASAGVTTLTIGKALHRCRKTYKEHKKRTRALDGLEEKYSRIEALMFRAIEATLDDGRLQRTKEEGKVLDDSHTIKRVEGQINATSTKVQSFVDARGTQRVDHESAFALLRTGAEVGEPIVESAQKCTDNVGCCSVS